MIVQFKSYVDGKCVQDTTTEPSDSFIDRFFDADEAHDLVFWRVVSRYSGNDKKVWKRIKV